MKEAIKDILATPVTEMQRTRQRRSLLLLGVILAITGVSLLVGDRADVQAAILAVDATVLMAGLLWISAPTGLARVLATAAAAVSSTAFTANAVFAAKGGSEVLFERAGALSLTAFILAIVAFTVKTDLLAKTKPATQR